MVRYFFAGILFLTLPGFVQFSWAGTQSVESLAQEAVAIACDRLKISPGDENIACLINAGYATIGGRSTRVLFDMIPRLVNISMGRGNLLPVHDQLDTPLWFAFVANKSKQELMMVHIRSTGQGLESTAAVNIHVDKGTSFEPFEKVFGKKAFSLVTLANGWADDIPEDLMMGGMFHDHLCSGVCSGYHTVKFIKKHIPLKAGERTIYIGAPAWCQDDYIMTALNLTPGKHGYYTMAYPWYRPWKTDAKAYDKLGGIVIRFNEASTTGWAYLLRFDWRESDFKAFIETPELKLDWKNQPWLHACYNRFFMQHCEKPEYFVSVIKRIKLKNRDDLNRLIQMGSNPLEEMLGPDRTWGLAHNAKKG